MPCFVYASPHQSPIHPLPILLAWVLFLENRNNEMSTYNQWWYVWILSHELCFLWYFRRLLTCHSISYRITIDGIVMTSCSVTLWYAMIYHVVPCYAIICNVMLGYAMLWYDMICYVMLWYAMICYVNIFFWNDFLSLCALCAPCAMCLKPSKNLGFS